MDNIDATLFDFIEKVVYINLSKRTDRREHMEKITKVFGDKVIRFEAIEGKSGSVGCSKSHIEVIRMAIEHNWKNVLVLEDDIEWNINDDSIDSFKKLAMQEFDVLLLGAFCPKFNYETNKLNYALATHSYIVNSHYFHTILENFTTGLKLLETMKESIYTLDVYWNKLIEKDNWLITIPCLTYQGDGYSDINLIDKKGLYNSSILSINSFIKNALWGDEINKIDVTRKIRVMTPIKAVHMLRSSLFISDPCPLSKKKLIIEYQNGNKIIHNEGSKFIIENGFKKA